MDASLNSILTWRSCFAAVLKVDRNENFGKLQAGYLFPEVGLHPKPEQTMPPAN
jgi:hypothetical protein